MVTLGFLHTAAAHVPTFDALLAGEDARAVHLVDESLLVDARAGLDVAGTVAARLGQLSGVDVIVCTCSTVGDLAEQQSAAVPVLRVDRPMGEQAVAGGGRVTVIAALESTLAPTRELLAQCAAAAGTDPVITEHLCQDAWPLFESGDVDGYLDRVAEGVRAAADSADVVVLAQASMAPVADRPDLGVRVLASPRPAVRRALDLARR